jgi:hypothetical protein
MSLQDNIFFQILEEVEGQTNDPNLIRSKVSSFFLAAALGTTWYERCVVFRDNPDPWMLNGGERWLKAHPVVEPDMRRVIHTDRIVWLCDALFTALKADGFDLLRQRLQDRPDTRASFTEAEIASLLVYNGCDVRIGLRARRRPAAMLLYHHDRPDHRPSSVAVAESTIAETLGSPPLSARCRVDSSLAISLLLDRTVMLGVLRLVRLPPLTAQLEVRVEVVVAPVVNAAWRDRRSLLLRRTNTVVGVRLTLGKCWRSDDSA